MEYVQHDYHKNLSNEPSEITEYVCHFQQN